MNATLVKALTALVPMAVLLGWSLRLYASNRTMPLFLQTVGAAFGTLVVLTHVAEGLQWFPWMHWGEAHSAGHYLDLSSATLALVLLPFSILLRAVRRALFDQSRPSTAKEDKRD